MSGTKPYNICCSTEHRANKWQEWLTNKFIFIDTETMKWSYYSLSVVTWNYDTLSHMLLKVVI